MKGYYIYDCCTNIGNGIVLTTEEAIGELAFLHDADFEEEIYEDIYEWLKQFKTDQEKLDELIEYGQWKYIEAEILYDGQDLRIAISPDGIEDNTLRLAVYKKTLVTVKHTKYTRYKTVTDMKIPISKIQNLLKTFEERR